MELKERRRTTTRQRTELAITQWRRFVCGGKADVIEHCTGGRVTVTEPPIGR